MSKSLIILSLLILGYSACRYKDPYGEYVITDTLWIVNNSDINILKMETQSHPDTLLTAKPIVFAREKDKMDFLILKHSRKSFFYDRNNFMVHDTATFPVYYYFFDENIVRSKTWAEISTNYLVLKRKSYTLRQLDSLNWTITYQ